MSDRTPVEYLVLTAGGGASAVPAALAAEVGLEAGQPAALIELVEDRLVLPAASGPRRLVVARLAAALTGPGAPSAVDRCFEAGLRLGAVAGGGRIWVADGVELSDPERDALWRGAYLGAQRPAAPVPEPVGSARNVRERDALSPEHPAPVEGSGASASGRPTFADGSEPPQLTTARAEAAAWVRELAERPANRLGPAEFAREIAAFAASAGRGLAVEVWSLADAEQRGFGAVAAVGGGSSRPPLVVRLSWGDDAAPTAGVLGLVGKGITFDSGGVNLKRDAGELAWMKSDMAAAAAVAAGLTLASAHAEPPTGRRVEAILPLCDNALSGSSMRPGDVIAHPGGETTEIVDTDCEGRLVLGDGISWCRSREYGRILDAGTLTDGGAGLRRTGLWSNDAGLARELAELGDAAADPLWPLPLPYGEEALESRVAGQRNAPMDRPDVGRHAAAFLAEIAGDTPWAHYDIGGTAYMEHPIAGWPEGPTGSATVAIAEAVRAWMRS